MSLSWIAFGCFLTINYCFILVQSRNLILAPITSECYNAFECIEHTLSSTYIECSGDLSCESSRITSPNAAGYIECSGDGSCKRSALQSDGTIHCDGHESCYYPDYLVANDEIICSGSYSCYNMNGYTDPYIQSATSNVLCQGSASCLNANIQSDLNTHCLGDQSCSSTSITSGTLYTYTPQPLEQQQTCRRQHILRWKCIMQTITNESREYNLLCRNRCMH